MGSRTKPRGTKALRRYPALVLLVAAAALAILLPSALNAPQTGPSALAEFAPVPGAGQGRSDVSEFGSASTGGLGFGSGGGGSAGDLPAAIGAPKQKRSSLKRCVGNPPRQTEDPLSPPCVAFFDGNNYGATTKGVTGDEIRIALYLQAIASDPPKTVTDCAEAPGSLDSEGDLACKAYSRFFNERYQTYGRRAHFWAFYERSGSGITAAQMDESVNPLALMSFPPGSSGTVVAEAARRKILSIRTNADIRKAYTDYAPLVIGFRPDREDQSRIASSYICTKLAGRPARLAGPLEDRTKTRKFGFYTSSNDLLLKLMKKDMESLCGLQVNDSADPLLSRDPGGANRLRGNGVTTAIVTATDADDASRNATQAAWFPEWIVPGGASSFDFDVNSVARTADQTQWEHAFGVTFDYRRDSVADQAWARAYQEGCTSCPALTRPDAAFLYDSLTMLFYGIQAAGPRLTPETLDKGMHAIPARASTDPYRPAAYFSLGNYTFIKDAMEIWWDPRGAAPGDTQPGCYRLVKDGLRFRAGDWRGGDEDIQKPGPPCQGSTVRS